MVKGPLRELWVFSRTLSAALVVAGYVLAGCWIGRSLAAQGRPLWAQSLAVVAGVAAALWAGFREIRALAKRHKD